MKRMKKVFILASLAMGTLGIGCSAEVPEESAPAEEAVATSSDALQAQIDAFVGSLVDRDVASLEAIVSSEILSRSVERHIDLPTFLEKQRGAMLRTFDIEEGQKPKFTIGSVALEGDAVRVSLKYGAEEVKKPFYFVRENGAWKLNIAPPGFSKSAPDGALFGRERYAVRNQNIYGNPSFTMTCYRKSGTDGMVTVAAGQRSFVECDDTCGWWAGSTFRAYGAYDGPTRKCDWNSWGDDVYINLLDVGGWRCNDPC